MSAADDDWRLQGQENYLLDAVLHFATYRAPSPEWDHDHCEFCWAMFTELSVPEALKEGYTTDDEYRWICPQCFKDFRERFRFMLR